jgi:hypothetical protein
VTNHAAGGRDGGEARDLNELRAAAPALNRAKYSTPKIPS